MMKALLVCIGIYLGMYLLITVWFQDANLSSEIITKVNVLLLNIFAIVVILQIFKIRNYSKKLSLLLLLLICSIEIEAIGEFIYMGGIDRRFESSAFYISTTIRYYLELIVTLSLLWELKIKINKILLFMDMLLLLIFLSTYIFFIMNTDQIVGSSLRLLSFGFYMIINMLNLAYAFMIIKKYDNVLSKEIRILVVVVPLLFIQQCITSFFGNSIIALDLIDFYSVLCCGIQCIMISNLDRDAMARKDWKPLEHHLIWNLCKQLTPIIFAFLLYIYTYVFYQNKYINFWIIAALVVIVCRSLFLAYYQNKQVNTFANLDEEFHGDVEDRFKTLLVEEEQYNGLYKELDIAVLMIDLDGCIVSMNPWAKKLAETNFVFEKNALLLELVVEEERKKVLIHFKQALRNKPIIFETKLVNDTGELYMVEMKFLPILMRGKLFGVYTLIKNITEIIQNREMLEKIAFEDGLTGLPNRAKFYQMVEEIIQEAKEVESHGAIFLDLNKFKSINDTMGHGVGDLVLIEISKRGKDIVQDKGILCRQSGDEFLIFLPYMNREEVAGIASRIAQVMQQPMEIDQFTVRIGASIGIAMYPDDGANMEEVIGNADIAMYEMKKNPGDSYIFFDQGMKEALSRKKRMEADLKFGIERNEFVLYYQPKVEAIHKNIIGVEALIRWAHPELGMIPPLEFITLAENTGFIIELGQWVLETACKQWIDWVNNGLGELSIGINVSHIQLDKLNYAKTVISTVEKYGVSPRYIDLEITESIAMSNEKRVLKTLKELHEYGFTISMDDFGIGYSSLEYLTKYPIDSLKIDRSFLSDFPDVQQKKIVEIIITMAHKLGLRVIAEGIETKEQKEYLLEQNCRYMQGYYFSKPYPAEELSKYLVKKDW